ncbi:MAG TPA: RnfABCDGE type electron transport complex subunit C, partial [Sphaerochaeta sp.]|nr:RnfABCDGE type electron transport complex subunit C [Sphaerochaeta sp.]
MQKVPTFSKGGVHPRDQKVFSSSKPIERLPMPSELLVSLSQHLGAPAKALKAKGDTVIRGEKIGEASGFISAHVHAPVNGTIKDIRKVTLANSIKCDAFVIVPDSEQPSDSTETIDWKSQERSSLLSQVKDLGIVGLGGATFPAHVKFSIPAGRSVDAFVVNGVECEPYLTADYRIMLEKGDEVLIGAMIGSKIIGAKRTIIGIEMNKVDCIEHLSSIAKEKGYPIEIIGLKVKYPQGDEKQLLKATIHKEIPSGKLPLDIGAVVANVGTCHALYEAIVLHKSLYERVISITGECIKEPKNVLAPIGTKMGDLLSFCGGFSDEPAKLVSGGPMMGFSFFDENTPMVKGS